jgi:membrane protease YdiL (CAAX protease family)
MVIYQRSRSTHLADIAIVVFVSVLAYLGELAFADHLPWGDEARGVIAVIAGAATAVAMTLGRGGSLADLGFRRPARWATVPAWAFGILVVFVVAQNVVPLLAAPFFDLPEPDMSRYDAVRGNLPAAVSLALLLPLTAAIPEEILYRGFLIERLTHLFAGTRGASVLAVLAQALMFGSVHFQWGFGGIVVTAIMGAVWGFAFLLCGRNLWIVIIAHSAAHIAMLTQLYFAPPPQ